MSFQAAQVLALMAVWLIALSLNVSRLRLRYKVSFGDGGHKDLLVATRVHGNALEQSVLLAVLLLALEVQPGGAGDLVKWLGIVFLLARVLHAAAAFSRRLPLRQLAHLCSMGTQVVAAVALLV
ncbi:MAG: MAPEG family protein [Hydrogenophaga sp.]|uniref:MAPEG family protein n=1 Tax=Hydrogenophaga sp. TaxID=1904254 RepID=UPI002AB9B22B|nr:MAPEG family protein [Hydrogenophaga sp.]MDZ4173276.1 MAPEG family protein [Hydrogenophaga sp.]